MLDPCAISTSLRHQIMVTVNKMDEWIACADATRSGRYINPPLPMLDPRTDPYKLTLTVLDGALYNKPTKHSE